METFDQYNGQIQRPGKPTENVRLLLQPYGNLTDAERAAGVQWVNPRYAFGNVLRYGENTTPGTTDMAPAIQRAVDSVAEVGGIVYIPPGDFLIASSINLASVDNVHIRGAGINASSVIVGAASVRGFNVTGTSTRCSIADVWIGAFSALASTYGIYAEGSGGVVSELHVFRAKVQNVANPIYWDTVHQSWIDRVHIVSSISSAVTGVALNLVDCVSIRVKNVQGIPTVDFGSDGIRLTDDCDTVIVEGCDMPLGFTGYGYRCMNPAGSTGPRLVRFTNCYAEECAAGGFIIEDGRDVRLSGCHAAINGAAGYAVSGGDSVHLQDCLALQNDTHGFAISGGTGVSIVHCDASNNSQDTDDTYDGINIGANVAHVRVLGCRSGDYILSTANGQRYGLTVNATGTDYIVVGDCDLQGNTTGDMNFASGGSNNQVRYDPGTSTESPPTYTPSNVTPDRAFDADSVLIAELADVVGTLIADLQSRNILS